MRIVHLDTGRTWRGGQNQVFLLIRELKKRGLEQLLITPPGTPLEQKIQNMGVKIKNLNPANDLDIISGWKLKKIVSNYAPGIVHFHTAKSLGVGSLTLRKFRKKTVFTRRVDFPLKNNILNKIKYGFPGKLVVISDFIKKQMLESGFKNPERIYSSVDTEKFKSDKKTVVQKPKNFKVGMSGALNLNHKDFLTFIRAAQKVIEKNKKVKFYIAGTGRDEKKILEFIKERELGRQVRLKGFVEDMPAFYHNLDVLVHTVHYEGLGTSVLEGMASGLPVVATRVGGLKEVVKDGINGFLVAKKDDGAVFDQLQKILYDKSLRKKLGVRGRTRVEEKFSVKKMVNGYIDIYRKIDK